ncbi:hypothetical protein [Protofrankia symbiont of Coriaria ruscifolia]|uniref:hypothetical protein n=1 Tax=Protofrankia symbiont of Coriaria ruscifolia TaxID=1306542 RepID=UPI001F5F59D2|nr:hypothetical protein [Protofrankia symbiont of Coriaria ruscifolia]
MNAIRVAFGSASRSRLVLDVTVDGVGGAALGVMSQGELHALGLALFLPRATVHESPFRFVVIDDPVQTSPGTAGLWPHACVWLMRLALEAALRDLWIREHPAVTSTTIRAQLLSLHHILDVQTVARAEHLWACLSRAGHHHPYELSLTAAELRRWHEDVHAVVCVFARIPDAGGTPPSTGHS